MKKHVMAITYAPKIDHVRSGACRQTIRAGNKISEGDQILLHGWEGAPYRSKWSWRMRVTVGDVVDILVDYQSGIGVHTGGREYDWRGWESEYANRIATWDFIDPPTGIGLRDVLERLNGNLSFVDCQIIRW